MECGEAGPSTTARCLPQGANMADALLYGFIVFIACLTALVIVIYDAEEAEREARWREFPDDEEWRSRK